MNAVIHVDSFSGGVANLKPKHRQPIDVLGALAKDPRVSTFDMSESVWLWQGIKSLKDGGLITELDEPYPWHKYALTGAGWAMLRGGAPTLDPRPPAAPGEPFTGATDPLYPDAIKAVVETQKANISWVQRQLRIGYNRAAIMIEAMEAEGVVEPAGPDGKRKVLRKSP